MHKKLTQRAIDFNKIRLITVGSCFFLLLTTFSANGFTAEQERWLNSNDESDVSQVNEGKLEFINGSVNKEALHSINKLTISKKSIDNGWVDLQQCYHHLDKLDNVEITYKYRFMKNLMLVSKKNIESVKVNKQSIQLNNVKDNAEICVSAKVRIFYQNKDLSFSLINGPYHRRFLDGFYPYHVSLNIHYPDSLLLFQDSTPEQQNGFSVIQETNKIIIDTYFEGILNTEIRFKLKE